jgi:urease accessory protein
MTRPAVAAVPSPGAAVPSAAAASNPTAAACLTAPGWRAELDLRFARRAATTVLTHNAHRGPLQVQKALYPEGSETCHIALLHPPGGIVGGDDLRVRVSLSAASRVLLTTPGATKWYRSESAPAAQSMSFVLEDQAVLECLPREHILFDGAAVSIGLDVDLAATATYVGWDLLCFGRRASGEIWRRGQLRMQSSIRRQGRLLWSESANIDAAGGFSRSAAGLAGLSVSGTLLVAGAAVEDAVVARCRGLTPVGREARYAVTRVASVFVARYLGDSAEAGFQWFTELWTLLRPEVAQRTVCAPRVWAC